MQAWLTIYWPTQLSCVQSNYLEVQLRINHVEGVWNSGQLYWSLSTTISSQARNLSKMVAHLAHVPSLARNYSFHLGFISGYKCLHNLGLSTTKENYHVFLLKYATADNWFTFIYSVEPLCNFNIFYQVVPQLLYSWRKQPWLIFF